MWTDYAIAIVLGVAIGLLVMMYKNRDYSNIKKISKKDFINNMRKGQLIDVRSKEEFAKDKINGARNFTARGALTLRKDQSVFLYCANGKKSYRVAKKLSNKGFPNIYVLSKGFKALNSKSNT
jgi:rhodanese-related sulfurtransferase